MTASVEWYFDFVSPYSYIALHRLERIAAPLVYRPVLFAGLLSHWGQKGPAEIAAKRRWTYRWSAWWAAELGIPFRYPEAHPFNPLPHLRLALACDCAPAAVKRIFEWLWMSGGNAADAARFSALCAELGVDPQRLASEEIKDALRKNGEQAIARGVFGVPSFVADGEVFWGADAIDFLNAFLRNPGIVRNDEMRRLDDLPAAAVRKS